MAGKDEHYDVALSYAGEQGDYVRRVAERLEAEGINVFFDDLEQTKLWGHDLAVRFDDVYRRGARFVVPFMSREYAAKAWPQHEFKSALARAVEAKEPYILPVRFDRTELPGLRPTIHYLDGAMLSPEQVAAAILERVGHTPAPPSEPERGVVRVPKLPPTNFNPYAEAERAVALLREELTRQTKTLEASGLGVHAQTRNDRFMLRVMRSGQAVYTLDVWIGGDWGDNTICFSTGAGGHVSPGSTNAHGTIEWDKERGVPIIKVLNMSLLRDMGREYRLTAAELAEEIWEELCRRLESGLQ